MKEKMLEAKLQTLMEILTERASALGLVFVGGPDPAAKEAPSPSISMTNGQARGVCLFAVAESN
jgi:hypothetical protein